MAGMGAAGDAGRNAERFARWMFEDRRTGRIVVAQPPNAPLLAFAGAMALEAALRPRGLPRATLRLAQAASLTLWAGDELLRGVNPWRRMMGAAALVAVPVVALR